MERRRLLAAAEEIIAEQGVSELTVESLCAASGVSRAGFRAAFAERAELLVALHDDLGRRVNDAMARAYEAQSSWLDGVRAALEELLSTLQSNIALARFMMVDCAIDESRLPSRRAHLLSDFADALERDRPATGAGEVAPPFGAVAIVGAVAAILHGRLLEEPVPPLTELTGQLMGMIVLPYLGSDAARTELARPTPEAGASPPARGGKFVKRSGTPRPTLRLTERTVATLRAIDEHPGLSNREVAAAAGISDPGQASKLLARLCGLELIECASASRGRPVGKAWRLTPAGRELLTEAQRAA